MRERVVPIRTKDKKNTTNVTKKKLFKLKLFGLIFIIVILLIYYITYFNNYTDDKDLPLIRSDTSAILIKASKVDKPIKNESVYEIIKADQTHSIKTYTLKEAESPLFKTAKMLESEHLENLDQTDDPILKIIQEYQNADIISAINNTNISYTKHFNVIINHYKTSMERSRDQKRGYKLEMYLSRSYDEAVIEKDRLYNNYTILNQLPYEIQKYEAKNGIFYKILIGNFSSHLAAKSICRKLILNKETCLITFE